MTFLAAPPKLSEARFQKQVVELAELLHWGVWHDRATNQRSACRACKAPLRCAACATPATVVRNPAGLLDLILIRRPRVLWVELKSDRGRLTPEQRATISDLRACGQEAYVFRPRDFETITRLLR